MKIGPDGKIAGTRSGIRAIQAGAPAEPVVVLDHTIERLRDIIIVRLRARKPPLPYRKIGGILGMSHVAVMKRFIDMPPQVKEHYAELSL